MKKQAIFFLKSFFSLRNNLIFGFFIFSSLSAIEVLDSSLVEQKEEEALFLRRIIEFWEENKYAVVEEEIENYVKTNTPTQFFDYLYALLGDVYLSEEKITSAIESYQKVEKWEIKEKIFLNYLQSLYHAKQFSTLCIEADTFLTDFIAECDEETSFRFCYLVGDASYNLSLEEKDASAKKKLANNAKRYLKELLNTTYQKEVIESLADIEVILQNHKDAVALLRQLADKNPERKEEYLFRIATIQLEYDREEALKTFTQIVLIGKERKNEAAFNKLILLVEEEKWSELLLVKDQIKEALNQEQCSVLDFYLAKSLFLLGEKNKAVELILGCLNGHNIENDYTRVLLQMLVALGEDLKEEGLFNQAIEKYEEIFKEDLSLAKMYLTRAVFHKNQKNYQKSKQDFDKIEQKFPDFKDDNYFLEAAHLYYQTKDFFRSRLRFKSYLTETKDEDYRALSWRFLIFSSIRLTETGTEEKKEIAKKVLIKDLEEFLKEVDFSDNPSERIECQTLLISTKYELNQFQEAIQDFKEITKNSSLAAQKPKLNFLAALCYKNLQEPQLFCEYAERALFLDKEKALDQKSIRLSLYNAYISQKELDKAAENLFLVVNLKEEIKLENKVWLANYYYSQVMKESESHKNKEENLQKALFVFELLVKNQIEDLSDKNLFLEEEALKLVELYEITGDLKLKKELLESVEKNYQKEKDFKAKERVFYELARVYQKEEEVIKAKEYFKKVLALDHNKNTYFKLASSLYLSRLELQELEKNNSLNFNNPVVIKELSYLKNLKLKKNLASEPLHLEAALDYVNVHYQIEKSLEQKIELLIKVKQDFSEKEDIISQDYQNSKGLYPQKAKLLEAYLEFIDAQILLAKAQAEKREEFSLRAKIILQKMLDQNLLITTYLDKKVKEELKELEDKKTEEISEAL